MGEIESCIEDCIATVTLSNPAVKNAISARMWTALRQTLDTLGQSRSLRCVIIRGASGHFSSGADISEFPALRGDLDALRRYHESVIAPALDAVDACVHPTIAAIEGACIGGGLEIACRCDLRICGQSARLGVPINRLGFAMAPRELEGLIALTGRAIALELLLEGGIFDAFEAQSKHLVTRVVPDARVVLETWESARRIAAGAPLAARINKRMVRRLASPAAPLSADEISFAYSYAHSADHAEGVGAFLGGREPRFTGT